ncbi:SusE domain-containing protein [Pedobacter frigoris]|uniref:SusE outer membrane protein domain-containing protein n=1 Tax=Pedobacter frigoris TaxID=2571272 RepID=A0A4U1CLF5_9SPHI|nr:SusE domain-containing protein [Pedobacter frigoris]TKC07131.1 hypothetical protein FA047_07685 [Pedobacter frigoris]
MKTNILSKLAFSLIVLLTFSGCAKEEKFKEVTVTEVTTLYAPDNGRNVTLQASGNPSLYFEWEKAVAQDNGLVYYDVVFDKESGDFSKPIYVAPADNNGISRGAVITHKVLNQIAALAGIPSATQGTIKWTVKSSRGLTKVMSKQIRTLTITRLSGIDAPTSVFLTGEGSEGGTNLAQALNMKGLTGGNEFEIFTRLLAGKKYSFVDSKTSASRTFSVDASGTTFKENANGGTVAKDGIYRVKLDFLTGSASIVEVNKIDLWMCTPQKRNALTYQGKGVWKLTDLVPDFTSGGFGDDRYFFWITMGGVEQKLGSINRDNQPPAAGTGPYFNVYINESDKDRWNFSFKFPNRSATKCSITLTLSPDVTDYNHAITY